MERLKAMGMSSEHVRKLETRVTDVDQSHQKRQNKYAGARVNFQEPWVYSERFYDMMQHFKVSVHDDVNIRGGMLASVMQGALTHRPWGENPVTHACMTMRMSPWNARSYTPTGHTIAQSKEIGDVGYHVWEVIHELRKIRKVKGSGPECLKCMWEVMTACTGLVNGLCYESPEVQTAVMLTLVETADQCMSDARTAMCVTDKMAIYILRFVSQYTGSLPISSSVNDTKISGIKRECMKEKLMNRLRDAAVAGGNPESQRQASAIIERYAQIEWSQKEYERRMSGSRTSDMQTQILTTLEPRKLCHESAVLKRLLRT